MLNLAAFIPVWLLSLSLFHFTIVLNRFQQGFDLLTPSVIQRYVAYSIEADEIVMFIDPPSMQAGISAFFHQQWQTPFHAYVLDYQYYQTDQVTRCVHRCAGVAVTLRIELYQRDITFSRHYQLTRYE
jgi:hypothetical protein